jgi:HK97 gp10 family phage protein
MPESGVFGTEELFVKFRQLTEEVQGDTLVKTVQTGAEVVRSATVENIKEQGLMRTHTLSRSVHQEVTESGPDYVSVDVGTDLEYAAVHEFGGTIQAKSSKYLAIPIGSYRGSPRSHGDLRLRKTARGNLILIDPEGIVQYVLKQSVEIPARPYLRPAADENHAKVTDEMAYAWQKQIEKAAGK